MPALDQRLARLAHRQHGLVTRAQLFDSGLDNSDVGYRVRTDQLLRVDTKVYFVAGGTFSWKTRVLAACLASGGVASHRCAAVLWRLDGFRPGSPEITVVRPNGYRRDGVRVHRITSDSATTTVRRDGIPTTDIVTTFLDLASLVGEQRLEAVLDEVLHRRLATWPEILDAFERRARPGVKGIAALRRLIDARAGDERAAESELERRFLRLVRAAGSTIPQKQVEIRDHDGAFIMRADFGHERIQVAFELDSKRHHATGGALTDDKLKRRQARRAGWTVHEYTDEILRRHDHVVRQDLAEVEAQLQVEGRLAGTGFDRPAGDL